MNKASYSNNISKLATVNQARERYKLSRNLLMKIAEDNGAVYRIGRTVRLDIPKLDKAIEQYKGGDNMKSEIAIEFENCFRYRIANAKTREAICKILSEMEETFRETVRNNPSCRDSLSAVYQNLKMQCNEAS